MTRLMKSSSPFEDRAGLSKRALCAKLIFGHYISEITRLSTERHADTSGLWIPRNTMVQSRER